MFGQAMATFVPPMLQGTVVFMRGYNPHEIVRQVKTRRISVLVSVPKILDVLADHVARLYPDVRRRAGRKRGRREALVAVSRGASSVRPEVLVVRRRRRAARVVARIVLGPARICRRAGLRPHRNRAHRDAEPSVLDEQGIGRQTDRRRRHQDRARRRNSRARRERHDRVLRRARSDGRGIRRTAGSTPATSASSTRQGRLFIRGRKKEMIVTPEGLNVFPGRRGARRQRRARRQGFRRGRRDAERRRARAGCARRRAGHEPGGCRQGGERAARRSPAHSRRAHLARRRAAAHRRHEETETSRDPRVAADGRVAGGVRLARHRASNR